MSEPQDERDEGAALRPEDVEADLARYLPRLRAYLRLRMGPELRAKESASDLAQSTCREVLQHLDRYTHRGEANFRQWLFKSAQRKLANRIEHYRAGKREVGREVQAAGAGSSDDALAALYQTISTPSRELMRREWIEQLEAAFEGLSEPHREVILLSRVVGLSHAEIASEMGRTVVATRSLLHRALAELTEQLM
jgi:RNA polymerase sigma-70 factor (ECF subfamily)